MSATREWSGGEYSALRTLLALTLAAHTLALANAGHPLVAALSFAATLSILAGLRDRMAALLATALLFLGPQGNSSGVSWLAFMMALTLHAATPAAPYGSLAARGREDPGGGWRLPDFVRKATWRLLALCWLLRGFIDLGSQTWPIALLELAAPLLFATGSLRTLAWTTLLGVLVGKLLLGDAVGGFLILHLLAFEPSWVRSSRTHEEDDWVFYDGDCALCHGFVRFLLAEDQPPHAFRFAAQDSARFANAACSRESLGLDAVAVSTPESDALLWRSDAVIHIAKRLGGVWSLLGSAIATLPKGLRDAAYDVVAKRRKLWFGTKTNTCPLVSPSLRARIDNQPAGEDEPSTPSTPTA